MNLVHASVISHYWFGRKTTIIVCVVKNKQQQSLEPKKIFIELVGYFINPCPAE